MDSGELSFNAFFKDINEIEMRLVAEKVRETEIRKLELSKGWVFFFFFGGKDGVEFGVYCFWVQWGSMSF